jgi:hypothetical protein
MMVSWHVQPMPLALPSADPNSLINHKVYTRWPDDNNFYEATITRYNPLTVGLNFCKVSFDGWCRYASVSSNFLPSSLLGWTCTRLWHRHTSRDLGNGQALWCKHYLPDCIVFLSLSSSFPSVFGSALLVIYHWSVPSFFGYASSP